MLSQLQYWQKYSPDDDFKTFHGTVSLPQELGRSVSLLFITERRLFVNSDWLKSSKIPKELLWPVGGSGGGLGFV